MMKGSKDAAIATAIAKAKANAITPARQCHNDALQKVMSKVMAKMMTNCIFAICLNSNFMNDVVH